MKVILRKSEELIVVGDKKTDQHGRGLWAGLITLLTLLLKLVDVVYTRFHDYPDDNVSSEQTAVGTFARIGF